MLLIWRGHGLIVIPIMLVAGLMAILSAAAATAVFGRMSVNYVGLLLVALALVGAAFTVRWVARYFDARESRQLIDPRTGAPVILRREHSLYFIRLEHWATIMLVAAGLMTVGQIASWF